MNYPAFLCLLVCSLTVILAALALPFVTSGPSESQRFRLPRWMTSAAVALLLYAAAGLRTANPGQQGVMNAMGLTAALIAGVTVKWLMETIARKKIHLHERVLFGALLVAPLVIVLTGRMFGTSLTPGTLVLWFLNGYCWHTFFSDIERIATPERMIIRRREPPTLPYDFRKPEIE